MVKQENVSDGGTVEHLMVEQWNNHGGTVEHSMVEQWKKDGETVEHLMVEQYNISCWNGGTEMVAQ